ncbi:MAG: phosphate acetyltransferase [Candidatus Omnitrophica bacterium]|nr:phosphate acetyltransferase [Candidatus Omnitrophota bacterium]
MSKSLYITASESASGKSVVALGVMEMLCRHIARVGFFRPVITPGSSGEKDKDIELIAKQFGLKASYEDMYCFTSKQVQELIAEGKREQIIEQVIEKYGSLKDRYDFILIEGTDYNSSTAAYEFDINAELCKNLESPVLLVVTAHQKSIEQTISIAKLALESLATKNCETIATVINRVDSADAGSLVKHLQYSDLAKEQIVCAIPEEPYLGFPTVEQIAHHLNARILLRGDRMDRHVSHFSVAAMQLRNFLFRIKKRALIITPGDRADVIVACCAAVASRHYDKIAGILLTGGLEPEDSVWDLVKGFPEMVPVLGVDEDTFSTATAVNSIPSKIAPDDSRKIARALSVFEKNVPVNLLREKIIKSHPSVLTPKIFEYHLVQKAREQKKNIVLPEGEEERILTAADMLLHRDVVNLTILGNEAVIRQKADKLGLNLEKARIIDSTQSEWLNGFAETYYELRKAKGITKEKSLDLMNDPVYFATMMVHKGLADGMVSGSIHSTASTIRPAFEIIKTMEGCSVVSSVFFMCLPDRVLVYGDCAVNPDPDATQLAEIAVSSALTAKAFGVEPIVAMLSYSSGGSGKGADVEKVREATMLAKEKAQSLYPGMLIDGPLQYDAAVDPETAQTKMPDSPVAGKATVLIFPDLNTGNNTYKAVQRTAGVVAIGPVLQGLKKPVNDLSRGCTVPDIFNTVAITAIQAQSLAPTEKNEDPCYQHR